MLLLSDGLANVGVTDPNAIRADVKGYGQPRVSTSTIGVGDDYNEDLLEAMAQAGDGNYYYVETSRPVGRYLPDRAQRPDGDQRPGCGAEDRDRPRDVVLVEVLNEMEREPSGRLKLPNLVMGMPIAIVVRLKVPPQADREEICRFTSTGKTRAARRPGRRSLAAALIISAVPARQWSDMPVDLAVAEQVALLMAARARKEVISAIDRGDEATAIDRVRAIRTVLSNAPQTAEVTAEWADMEATQELFTLGQMGSARKASHYRQYFRKRGRGTPPRVSETDPAEGQRLRPGRIRGQVAGL